MLPRFIQVHSLHTYTGALLNRDDSGLAKRMRIGGHIRTRISSQCLKRHWRTHGGAGLGLSELGHESVRTRLVEEHISPILDARLPELQAEIRKGALEGVVKLIYGEKNVDRKKRQALLLGTAELDYLGKVAGDLAEGAKDLAEVTERVKTLLKDSKMNWKAIAESSQVAGGISGALFGRMITADPASNLDAALHVAHAFTVHTQESEGDALTVVDDLSSSDSKGSGGMFDTEINTGTYYGYVVIDVAQLVANLGGPRVEAFGGPGDYELAASVVERIVGLIARVSPGAKKGSTAPYGYAETVLVEIGDAQPRQLSGAFQVPVPLKQNRSPGEIAAQKMQARIDATDTVYAGAADRMFVSIDEESDLKAPRAKTLEELAAFASGAVRGLGVKAAA